tara:strand:- start:71 stop:304 length:234 start_codon:yes stop_codon:yes gene_type:complete
MTEGEKRIRAKGDLILQKMSAFQNYGTGRPSYITKKEWESVTTKAQMKSKIVELWKELQKIDPMRAEKIKPQNPFVQ